MALIGHSGSHRVQSVHSSGSSTRKLGPSWKQSTGHTSTQSVYLHLMQFWVTTKGMTGDACGRAAYCSVRRPRAAPGGAGKHRARDVSGAGPGEDGAPYGIRTRVLALRGPRPRPLDEGSRWSVRRLRGGGGRLDDRPRGSQAAMRLASIATTGCRWATRAGTFFQMPTDTPSHAPVLRSIPREQHPISRKDISPNALRVLYRLREGGHEAYLVGGAVRDLLVGGHPKDFDVATSATPEEVRALFRNCRLIGRRFRLAHVVFGR